MRLCRKCGETKSPDDFHRGSSWCKPCKIEVSTAWNKNNPERHRTHCRGKHKRKQTLRKYGLSEIDYQRLLDLQGGACRICGTTTENLVVDHDHATDRVRGLLCKHCNWALGFVKDSPERLRAAATYLEQCASVNNAAELVTP